MTQTPVDGVFIYGLFFEGCGWEPKEKRLTENRGREVVTPAPIIWIVPGRKAKEEKKLDFHCPVYKTMERKGVLLTTGHSTNFIMYVDFYSDVDPKNWIKRGVALICQLND